MKISAPPRSSHGSQGGGDAGAALDENGQYKHIVHMRGLPYRASEDEIHDFFAPVRLLAVRILMNQGSAPK